MKIASLLNVDKNGNDRYSRLCIDKVAILDYFKLATKKSRWESSSDLSTGTIGSEGESNISCSKSCMDACIGTTTNDSINNPIPSSISASLQHKPTEKIYAHDSFFPLYGVVEKCIQTEPPTTIDRNSISLDYRPFSRTTT